MKPLINGQETDQMKIIECDNGIYTYKYQNSNSLKNSEIMNDNTTQHIFSMERRIISKIF